MPITLSSEYPIEFTKWMTKYGFYKEYETEDQVTDDVAEVWQVSELISSPLRRFGGSVVFIDPNSITVCDRHVAIGLLKEDDIQGPQATEVKEINGLMSESETRAIGQGGNAVARAIKPSARTPAMTANKLIEGLIADTIQRQITYIFASSYENIPITATQSDLPSRVVQLADMRRVCLRLSLEVAKDLVVKYLRNRQAYRVAYTNLRSWNPKKVHNSRILQQNMNFLRAMGTKIPHKHLRHMLDLNMSHICDIPDVLTTVEEFDLSVAISVMENLEHRIHNEAQGNYVGIREWSRTRGITVDQDKATSAFGTDPCAIPTIYLLVGPRRI